MKELSLHILDIAQNSVRAGASLIRIEITEDEETLTFSISDNGCGMDEAFLRAVTDPFTTTRTTRGVGLGIPLLKLSCESTGGAFSISSRTDENHGTVTTASFIKTHIDYTPLGDMTDTVCTLVQGSPTLHFIYRHTYLGREVSLDTEMIRRALGDEISLAEPEILLWIRESLNEEYQKLKL